MPACKHFLRFFILLLATCIYVFAQDVDLNGKVTNREGEPVAGASILLKNKDITVTTDQDGMYVISGTGTATNMLSSGSLYHVSMNNDHISFSLEAPNNVTLAVYNVNGRAVCSIHKGQLSQGRHQFRLPTQKLSNQMYILCINIGSNVSTHKIIPMVNSFALSSGSAKYENKVAFVKSQTVDDSLAVTCDGYEAKTVQVTEYVATIDIVLEFDWSDFEYPEIVFQNKYSSFSEFTDRFPSIEDTAMAIAYGVCRKLYRKYSESLKLEQITFILDDDPNTIGWKAGKPPKITICIGGPYLQKYMNNNGTEEMADEVKGIMWHEYTHGYQYDDGNSNAIIGIIEGVADCVRYLAGFIDISQRRPGGNWDSGYKTSAFFLAWLQEEYQGGDPEFLYKFNQSFAIDDGITWTKEAFQDITGETVESLWDKYQDAISLDKQSVIIEALEKT